MVRVQRAPVRRVLERPKEDPKDKKKAKKAAAAAPKKKKVVDATREKRIKEQLATERAEEEKWLSWSSEKLLDPQYTMKLYTELCVSSTVPAEKPKVRSKVPPITFQPDLAVGSSSYLSSFNTLTQMRLKILERRAALQRRIAIRDAEAVAEQEDAEKTEGQEAKIDQANVIPKTVSLAISGIFALIADSSTTDPATCNSGLSILQQTLDTLQPGDLANDTTEVLDSLQALLMSLLVDKIGAGINRSRAASTLISLILARGSISHTFQTIRFLLATENASEKINVPAALVNLARGMLRVPEEGGLSCPRESSLLSLARGWLPGAPEDVAVAADGTFLYIHTSGGLYKIGTGIGNSEEGKIHAHNAKFHPNAAKGSWLGFVSPPDQLLFRGDGVDAGLLIVVNRDSLEEQGVLACEEGTVAQAGQTLFTDGHRIWTAEASGNDIKVVVREPVQGLTIARTHRFPWTTPAEFVLGSLGKAPWDEATGVHTVKPVMKGEERDAVAHIALSNAFVLYTTVGGRVLFVGDASMLGVKAAEANTASPTVVSTFAAHEVAKCFTNAEGAHTLFIDTKGALFAIGSGKQGQLGNGTSLDAILPVAVELPDKAVTAAVALERSAVVTADGSLFWFGKDTPGEGGNSVTPKKISDSHQIVDVALGDEHMIALTRDGGVLVQGSNAQGQCGTPSETKHRGFTAVELPMKAVQVGARALGSTVLLEDGTVWVAGHQANNQKSLDKFTKVDGVANVTSIVCGTLHIVAKTAMGEVYLIGTMEDEPDEAKPDAGPDSAGKLDGFPPFVSFVAAGGALSYFTGHSPAVLAENALRKCVAMTRDDVLGIVYKNGETSVCRSFDLAAKGAYIDEQNADSISCISPDLGNNLLWTVSTANNEVAIGRYLREGTVRGPYQDPAALSAWALTQHPLYYVPSDPTQLVTMAQAAVMLMASLDAAAYRAEHPIAVENADEGVATGQFVYGEPEVAERYSSTSNGWGISDTYYDSITFEVSEDIDIAGIGMYGGGGHYNLDVWLLEGPARENTGGILSKMKAEYDCHNADIQKQFFDSPVSISAGKEYTISQKGSGGNCNYGNSGKDRVTVGTVEFKFKQPQTPGGDNGTSVNSGQIPQILFHSAGSKIPVVKKETSKRTRYTPMTLPATFDTGMDLQALKALRTMVVANWEAVAKIVEAGKSPISALLGPAFVVTASCRLLRKNMRAMIESRRAKKGKEQEAEISRQAPVVSEATLFLHALFGSRLFVMDIPAEYTEIVTALRKDVVLCFEEGFGMFFPKAELVRHVFVSLAKFVQVCGDKSPLLPGASYLLAAMANALSTPDNVKIISAAAVDSKDIGEGFSDVLAFYAALDKEAAERNRSKKEAASSEEDVLSMLLAMLSQEAHNAVRRTGAATSSVLSQALVRLMNALESTLVNDVARVLVKEAPSKAPPMTSIKRMDCRAGSWSYGGGVVDAVNFEVDTPIEICGFGLLGGSGHFTVTMKLMQAGEVLGETVVDFDNNTQEPEKCLFDAPISIDPNTDYTAWIQVTSGPTGHQGQNGKNEITADDGIIFQFKSSPASSNGTDGTSGQIPEIWYSTRAMRSAETPVDGASIDEEKSKIINTLVHHGETTLSHSTLLLSDLAASIEDASAEQQKSLVASVSRVLGDSPLLSVGLPVVLADLIPLANNGPRARTMLQLLLPLLKQIHRLARLLGAASSTPGVYELVVESAHPYFEATRDKQDVVFPQSVEYMTIEFDSRSGTCQVDDRVQLFADASLREPLTEMLFGDKNLPPPPGRAANAPPHPASLATWPTGPVVVPGNRLSVDFQTGTDYEKIDGANRWGYRITVTGHERDLNESHGLVRLEKEVAFLGAACVNVLIKAGIEPVAAEEGKEKDKEKEKEKDGNADDALVKAVERKRREPKAKKAAKKAAKGAKEKGAKKEKEAAAEGDEEDAPAKVVINALPDYLVLQRGVSARGEAALLAAKQENNDEEEEAPGTPSLKRKVLGLTVAVVENDDESFLEALVNRSDGSLGGRLIKWLEMCTRPLEQPPEDAETSGTASPKADSKKAKGKGKKGASRKEELTDAAILAKRAQNAPSNLSSEATLQLINAAARAVFAVTLYHENLAGDARACARYLESTNPLFTMSRSLFPPVLLQITKLWARVVVAIRDDAQLPRVQMNLHSLGDAPAKPKTPKASAPAPAAAAAAPPVDGEQSELAFGSFFDEAPAAATDSADWSITAGRAFCLEKTAEHARWILNLQRPDPTVARDALGNVIVGPVEKLPSDLGGTMPPTPSAAATPKGFTGPSPRADGSQPFPLVRAVSDFSSFLGAGSEGFPADAPTEHAPIAAAAPAVAATPRSAALWGLVRANSSELVSPDAEERRKRAFNTEKPSARLVDVGSSLLYQSIVSFALSHQQLVPLGEYMLEMKERARRRADGFRFCALLLSTIFSSDSLQDVLWFLSSAIHGKRADAKDGAVAEHYLNGLTGSGLAELEDVRAAFYELYRLLAKLMDTAAEKTALYPLLLQCWAVNFNRSDHAFLHQSEIFAQLSKLMTTLQVSERTGNSPLIGSASPVLRAVPAPTRSLHDTLVSRKGKESAEPDTGAGVGSPTSSAGSPSSVAASTPFPVGSAALQALVEVTGQAEITASSAPGAIRLLTDNQTETFWEAGGDTDAQFLAFSFPEPIAIAQMTAYVDSARDKERSVTGLSLYSGASASFLEKGDEATVPAKYTGWITLTGPSQPAKFYQLKITGRSKKSRIHNIKIYKHAVQEQGISPGHKGLALEALRIFRLLGSQVFGGLAEAGRDKGDGADLREYLVGLVFVDQKAGLSTLQRQVFRLVFAELQTEAQRLLESLDTPVETPVLASASTPSTAAAKPDIAPDGEEVKEKKKPKSREVQVSDENPDSYCFQLVSMVLSLAGAQVGQRFLDSNRPVVASLLSLLQTGTPRVQRQVVQIFRRLLPVMQPESLRSLLRGEAVRQLSPLRIDLDGGVIDYLLMSVAKALSVQIRGPKVKAAGDITLASAAEQTAAGLWLRGAISQPIMVKVVELLQELLKDAAWGTAIAARIEEAVLGLVNIQKRGHLQATQHPYFWIAMGSLAVIVDDRDRVARINTLNIERSRQDTTPRPFAMVCDHHDDGETKAARRCDTCNKSYCAECDRVVHLPKSLRGHTRSAIVDESELVVDVHEGCVRAKLSAIMLVVDAARGKTVMQVRQESTGAQSCRFCTTPITEANMSLEPVESPTLENVCNEERCKECARNSCTKTLACGHACGGIRGEAECLPCLRGCNKEGGPKMTQDADDMCIICWTDNLVCAPSIRLACGHVFHHGCVKTLLDNRWPGARITFGFMDCPICKSSRISHPELRTLTEPLEKIFEAVQTKALLRIKYMNYDQNEEVTKEGGRFYNNLAGYAMDRLAYYLCYKCKLPYFGGERQCEVDAGGGEAVRHDPKELMCGGCSEIPGVQDCMKHGKEYLEFKCRYCCSIAVWFCFGTTHFCEPCHNGRSSSEENLPCPVGPKGVPLPPGPCPLGVSHPPSGQEFALGCGVCRNAQSF